MQNSISILGFKFYTFPPVFMSHWKFGCSLYSLKNMECLLKIHKTVSTLKLLNLNSPVSDFYHHPIFFFFSHFGHESVVCISPFPTSSYEQFFYSISLSLPFNILYSFFISPGDLEKRNFPNSFGYNQKFLFFLAFLSLSWHQKSGRRGLFPSLLAFIKSVWRARTSSAAYHNQSVSR